MTLREKLCEPFDGLPTKTVDKLERIAEEFAIGFLDWNFDKGQWMTKNLDLKELLEIYKKEKKL